MSSLQEGLTRYLTKAQASTLQQTHVGIAGAGGLGSNVAMLLVRSGVTKLTIVDFDVVEASNLNRQAFLPVHIGQKKIHALASILYAIEPSLSLTLLDTYITANNVLDIFCDCSVVVEALDNANCKAICYSAMKGRVEFYAGASGLGGWGGAPMLLRKIDQHTVIVGDFTSEVSPHCPPMAPRVIMAAAMQADAVLSHILA